jgi:hypothetical protein
METDKAYLDLYLNLAREYPAGIENARQSIVVIIATNMLFKKYLGISDSNNTVRKLIHVGSWGKILGGIVKISFDFLIAVVIIHRKGNREVNVMTAIMIYLGLFFI